MKFMIMTLASLALLLPSNASAQRWRVLSPRVCSGGSCYQASYRATGFSYAASPCQAVETVQSAPEPCAPVYESYAPAPCQAVETVLTPPVGSASPEPCAPVETTPSPCESVEYEPTVYQCPTGACPLTVAKKVATLLDRVNATRAQYGLTALSYDATLTGGAQYQASFCASRGALIHGSGVAEILAQNGQGIETALTQWLNSPSHRALLLSSTYRFAGVAVHRDGAGRVWCAVRFR